MFQNPQQKNNMCICHNWRWSLDDNRTLDVCCRLLSPNFELDQVDHLRRFVWAAVGVVNGCSHGIFTLISWDVILTIPLWLTSYNYGLWLYSHFAYPNRLCLGPAGPPPSVDLNKPSSWTQCATPLRRNVEKMELPEANVRICQKTCHWISWTYLSGQLSDS